MSLVSRFKSPTAVKQFLDSEDGALLVSYFQELFDKSVRQLRRSNELREIFYAQGAADTAILMSRLRADIVQYQEDLDSGKIMKKENSDGVLEQTQTPTRVS